MKKIHVFHQRGIDCIPWNWISCQSDKMSNSDICQILGALIPLGPDIISTRFLKSGAGFWGWKNSNN